MKPVQFCAALNVIVLSALSIAPAVSQQKISVQLPVPQKQAGVPIPSGVTLLIINPSDRLKAERMKRSNDAVAAIQLGEKALSLGKSDKAIEAFQHSLQIEPYNGLALQRLAEAYTANQQPEQALMAYRSLIYPGPGQDWSSSNQVSPTVLMNYSLLLLQAGQEQEALAMYNRALRFLNYDQGKPSLEVLIPEIGPNGIPYTYQLLEAMDCLGIGVDTSGFDGKRLKEAAKLAPDSAIAHFYLGKYLYGHSEPGAKSALEQAIHLGDNKTAQAAEKYLQFCR